LVAAEDIFDSPDDGEDEQSVLLISRAPGVDFAVPPESAHPSSPTAAAPLPQEHHATAVSVTSGIIRSPSLPPSSPKAVGVRPFIGNTVNTTRESPTSGASPAPNPNITSASAQPYAYSRNLSMESVVRPALTDPVMLFPSSVRAAGYASVANPYSLHVKGATSESQLANTIPMSPVSMR
jgi:hypothetical protein